jgi:hypothetical protein
VQRKAFSGPFCLGVTRKMGEGKEDQRDAQETAKKSDGAKTRSWAGATPLFGPSVSKVTRGVAPALRRREQRRVFWPRRHKGREEKGLGKEKREAKMPSNSEQPLALKRKVRLEEHAGELLEDYSRFIGISAEAALDVVARRMTADDADSRSWKNQRRVQRRSGPVPMGHAASAEEMEAA